MTLVSFHPDDVDAVRRAVAALERERDYQTADRVADLADRMATERQHEIMTEVVRRLDARPALRVHEGGAG